MRSFQASMTRVVGLEDAFSAQADASVTGEGSASNSELDERPPPPSERELTRDAWRALLEQLHQRFDAMQIAEVTRAFTLARDAHAGVKRSSGEPYITHPLAVAGIVVDMQLDHRSVMAALLHDVLEDTRTRRSALVEAFGEEVAHMVDGVSKLTDVEFRSKEEAQAESFRKMLLAMVTDIRVIMIKLADRLHNMRTIGALRPDKQRRIGRETLEVYAPIASRLGMYALKNELEDLGFRACYPLRARILAATVEQAHRRRGNAVAKVTARIETALQEHGITGFVRGREKHLYSLYAKMAEKQLTFEQVFDVFGLRVVIESVEDCYRVLGIVHGLYTPLFHRFKDYIAVPKENGYRSLHTVVNDGASVSPIEVQIRTPEMDEYAESGIAAHWVYKGGSRDESPEGARTRNWLSSLVDLHARTDDTIEFVENVKIDLFPGEIYVFTPKGRIVQLSRGATPVDFAYAVHSDIGNACVAAMVDRRLASLSEPLKSGQSVEIITGSNASPSPMWLNSVVTAKARASIRQHLRALDRDQAVAFGERLLRRALGRYELSLEALAAGSIDKLLTELRLDDLESLYAELGVGLHLPSLIAERVIAGAVDAPGLAPDLPIRETAPVLVARPDDSTLHLSKCCRPIPGDSITGFIAAGTGVSVHRAGCRNVNRFRRRPRELVPVDWAPRTSGHYDVVISVHLANQPGALARVTSTMSLMNVNIEHMDFDNSGEDNISIRIVLAVEGRQQLARIVRRLRNLTVVRFVRRET